MRMRSRKRKAQQGRHRPLYCYRVYVLGLRPLMIFGGYEMDLFLFLHDSISIRLKPTESVYDNARVR